MNPKVSEPSGSAGEDYAVGDELPPSTGEALGSVEPHVFSNPCRASHWKQIYEDAAYEGRHRFDASFTWSADEEKGLKKRLDWMVMAWVWVMFSSLDLVRRNINRAVSDNMLDDLGANTNDYNTGNTIYLVTFLVAELPGGLISKKVGPFRYTPTIIIIWGVLSALQVLMNSRASFWAFRALIGLVQGGFIPEMVLYLSYFYKNNELPFKLSIFYTVIPVTQIYGALLAAGFLEMRGVLGWAGWQWLFLIEGLICVVIGLISFFVMPPSVTEPARAFRRPDGTNKWWTEREEKILVNRILRDDPTKGDMNNRTAVTLKGLWGALTNFDLWPIFIVGIFAWIPFQPTANYLSLILREMGYSVFESNMLTIPSYAIFAINVVVLGWLSEHFKERSIIGSLSNVWMLPFFIALVSIPDSSSPWVRYVLITGINSLPYAHSILVGMTSRNARSVGTRAVSTAVYNMTYQIGSIIAANIYRDEDRPHYLTANRALIGLCVANILLFISMKLYYIWRNRVLARKYLESSEAEKQTAIDMRFAH
ncbi:allantoate permease (permease for phthalate transporter) [Colletotrichum tofieldiae]|uniref:Allantoate permease (Permease for phthalate transporter) n=1 Tax=Colletotrichum tofieldiae TaxID=708197 RepID=A0A166MZ09_9PEZI|nr:allantoate permease (permease for phthalate transporter) [Colletotrichum tofieldiae]